MPYRLRPQEQLTPMDLLELGAPAVRYLRAFTTQCWLPVCGAWVLRGSRDAQRHGNMRCAVRTPAPPIAAGPSLGEGQGGGGVPFCDGSRRDFRDPSCP